MRKIILSALAAAALGAGTAAQADLIDGVGNAISSIFGIPYDPRPDSSAPIVNVYTDAYGRRYQVDAQGRQLPLDQFGSYRDQWGRTVYLGANNQPMFIEQNGQLIPYGAVTGTYPPGVTYAPSAAYDSDGDRVADLHDRYPNDPRFR